MNAHQPHPLVQPLITDHFQSLSYSELQRLKEDINKRIEEGINSEYWRKVRVLLGEEIKRKNEEQYYINLQQKNPFELISEQPVNQLQKVITNYTFIPSENKQLIPLVHCRMNIIIPKTKYSKFSGKSNPVTDGYEISVYYPNYKGMITYNLTNHPTNESIRLLTVLSEQQYQDVQIEIEHRSIEMSQRKNYTCYFENNLFHLKFSFKKEFKELKE